MVHEVRWDVVNVFERWVQVRASGVTADMNEDAETLGITNTGDKNSVLPEKPAGVDTETVGPEGDKPAVEKPKPTDENDQKKNPILEVTMKDVTSGCPKCGLHFYLPSDYLQRRQNDGKDFYCPNGHPMQFSKPNTPTEREKELQRKLDAVEEALEKLREENEEAQASLGLFKDWVRNAAHFKDCKKGVFIGHCTCGKVELMER